MSVTEKVLIFFCGNVTQGRCQQNVIITRSLKAFVPERFWLVTYTFRPLLSSKMRFSIATPIAKPAKYATCDIL